MIRPEKFREYISDPLEMAKINQKTKRLRLSVPQDLSFLGVFFFLFFFSAQHLQSTILRTLYPVTFMHGIKSPVVFHWIYSPSVLGTKPRWDGTPELGIL